MRRNVPRDVEERGMTAGQKDAERQRDARRTCRGDVLQGGRIPPSRCHWFGSRAPFQRPRFPVGFLKFTSAARKRGVLRRHGQAEGKAAFTAARSV